MNSLIKSDYIIDWSDIAFENKQRINNLNAIYILPSRDISEKRFIELIKQYLPKANLIMGIAKEQFISGFENQLQFSTLTLNRVNNLINKVNISKNTHKIYVLKSQQSEEKYIIDKLKLKNVIAINGSWKHTFHSSELYYSLINRKIDYELISPFIDEQEAKIYEIKTSKEILDKYRNSTLLQLSKNLDEKTMISNMRLAATLSYDYTFQTGCVLGKKIKNNNKYRYLGYSFNKVVPYQTYAMHNGSQREQNFSPTNDLNFYDTTHGEIEMILFALNKHINLNDTTLFVNLMPCPTCARMISETPISTIVYLYDHSAGYAFKYLTMCGKDIKRAA